MLRPLLEKLLDRRDLDEAEAAALLEVLIAPATTAAQRAALLVALRAKGETATEIAALARGLRASALDPVIPRDGPPIVDIVGTGGDASGSLNISTAAAILCASTGRVRVVKSGNRAVSSRSGAADVLAALGVPMPMGPEMARACLERTNFTFLFAPHYHPATSAVAAVRKELGVRTVFNILGPLSNPAQPTGGVIGAYSAEAASHMAAALARLPITRVFVVHTPRMGSPAVPAGLDSQGRDPAGTAGVPKNELGWDEATCAAPFIMHTVTPGNVATSTLDPRTLALAPCREGDLAGGDAGANAATIRSILRGATHGARSTIVLNAALALHSVNACGSLESACAEADRAIDDGRAARTLDALAAFGREASRG